MSPSVVKARCPGSSWFRGRISKLESPFCDLVRPLASWEGPLQLWFSFHSEVPKLYLKPICRSLVYLYLSCLSSWNSFITPVVEIFSSCLQIVLINSCSVNSCDLGVPLEGGELKVFLHCHLGHTFPVEFFTLKWWLFCEHCLNKSCKIFFSLIFVFYRYSHRFWLKVHFREFMTLKFAIVSCDLYNYLIDHIFTF